MPKIKSHLQDLYRTNISSLGRKNYLRLDMNENPQGLPDDFLRIVLSQVDGNFISTYPEYSNLERKIAGTVNLSEDNICLTNGSDAAIKYIFEAYVEKEDKVLLTNPTFAMYPVYCKMYGAVPVMVDYRDDLSFPDDVFLKNIVPGIKLIVIVNPNNPTGSVVDRRVITAAIEKALTCDALLIVDEAYFYFHPETMIEYVKEYNNLIVLRSFSKICSMAGCRLGYAAANPEIITNIKRVKPTFDVNAISVFLAENLLNSPEIIPYLLKEISIGREFIIKKLRKRGIDHLAGQANFILIKCGSRTEEIASRLQKEKILVSAGPFSPDSLKGHIRFTISNRKNMEIFWNAFVSIWDNP